MKKGRKIMPKVGVDIENWRSLQWLLRVGGIIELLE